MVKRIDECDQNRLRSYLDDGLSGGDQAELAEHLDRCADCQAALERLAAGTRLWDDLRALGTLRDGGRLDFPPMTGGTGPGRRARSRRSSSTSSRPPRIANPWAAWVLTRSSACWGRGAWGSCSRRSSRR